MDLGGQPELNAREIVEAVKAGTFRELKHDTITCDCQPGKSRRLARFFVGPDDEGVIATWVMVSRYRMKGRTIPAWATPIDRDPIAEGFYPSAVAVCPDCRHGWAVIPWMCYPVDGVHVGAYLLLRAGEKGGREPWAAGDSSEGFEVVGDPARGPARSWLVPLGPVTRGTVVDG